MRLKLFRRLGFLTCLLWLASALACTGMTGLGSAPGGFAEGGGSGGGEVQDQDSAGNSSNSNPNSNFDPGPAGGPGSLAPPAGALPGGAAPGGSTTTTLYQAPSTVAAADPFGGYRPGSEGQVQVGRSHLIVSTIGPNGVNNCNRGPDEEWVQVFPTGSSGATVYSWLSHAADGPFDPTGHFAYTKESGAARVNCYVPKDDGSVTNFEYVMLLATYTDRAGTVHRSDTITLACPSHETYEVKQTCLDLKIPPVLMQYQGNTIPPTSNFLYLNSGDPE